MLTKIRKLIEELNANDIRYCHWKSNLSLAIALAGQTDVDLLIHRKDADLLRTILSQLCFRPATLKDGESYPSVEHYFALDEESGALVHVHAYFRVITGESLAKNYRLPIEEMLLQNTRWADSVRVPTKSAELVVFILRMMLKHTSLVELALLARDRQQIQQEIQWLLATDTIDETLSLVDCWLPSLDTNLFSNCITALEVPAPLFRRIILGRQLRSRLRLYARHSAIRAWLGGLQKFTIMLLRRLFRSQKGMIPLSGGAVIAFVGPEATGKSTLLAEMSGWLGEHFAVQQVHAGKPKSTILSAIPNLLVPVLRSMLPTHRSSHVETQYASKEQSEKSQESYSLIFAIRSVLLAYDRRALLTRAFGRAANGTIVLCDRYPSLCSGTPDSPQLSHLPIASDRYSIRRLLARIEKRLYREIPPPDLVISLTVPVEVAVLRNEARGKKEPEDYVRLRHARSSNLEFGKTPIYKINTDQPLDKIVLEVKKVIWNTL
jgi:thymidylate kinase